MTTNKSIIIGILKEATKPISTFQITCMQNVLTKKQVSDCLSSLKHEGKIKTKHDENGVFHWYLTEKEFTEEKMEENKDKKTVISCLHTALESIEFAI